MSRISEKKNFSKMNIVFIAIILIQMICLVLTFVIQKTANHEDEFFPMRCPTAITALLYMVQPTKYVTISMCG